MHTRAERKCCDGVQKHKSCPQIWRTKEGSLVYNLSIKLIEGTSSGSYSRAEGVKLNMLGSQNTYPYTQRDAGIGLLTHVCVWPGTIISLNGDEQNVDSKPRGQATVHFETL